MNVVLAHNYYRSDAPSGENAVFEIECKLLQSNGHTVHTYTKHSDSLADRGLLGVVKGAASSIWNPVSAAELLRLVKDTRADIVHVHNTFPLISPAIFSAIRREAATVLTLHNYRVQCAAAIPLRDGAVCTKCIEKQSVLPALRYGCYRDSHIATAPMAASVFLHKAIGTWQKHVDAFIALSNFQKKLMIKGGLPEGKVHVKPNFFPGTPEPTEWEEKKDRVIFVGRLGEEKGVKTLLHAWRELGMFAPELLIVGDGPLRSEVESMASGSNVRFVGQISSEKTQRYITNSKLLILPSEWFEGFPMVIREAFALGTPVAASAIGPLPEIVIPGTNGFLFSPSQPLEIARCIRGAMSDERALRTLGDGARESFRTLYSEESNYAQLRRIYENAVIQNSHRAAGVS